ncbi:hypothetical protein ISN45_Aa07g040840 [Arabidopsis thaliana x Arabidopsis arenosa]|uniref:Uncharacterized protein n=1 Tax=Arabidopsis thaliana x Arabidopsis arenosa TaxID=1240361 RepID=A0A8T1YE78_9BRAS|nr:hypothetical protein ISN45_Aa07g040840 [Arabidopsis thaliana x Arabidopsis arenosa]
MRESSQACHLQAERGGLGGGEPGDGESYGGWYVERKKVLKAVRRAGKRAEFWPYPDMPRYFTSSDHYFKDTTREFRESYNYYRHGYNLSDRHGHIHVTNRGDDKVSNFFNDDNVHACRLM